MGLQLHGGEVLHAVGEGVKESLALQRDAGKVRWISSGYLNHDGRIIIRKVPRGQTASPRLLLRGQEWRRIQPVCRVSELVRTTVTMQGLSLEDCRYP